MLPFHHDHRATKLLYRVSNIWVKDPKGGGGIYLHVKKSFEKWELERDRDQIKRRKEEEIKNYSSEIF